MARYFENTSTFNFSWDQVARGYWKRYPNPQRSPRDLRKHIPNIVRQLPHFGPIMGRKTGAHYQCINKTKEETWDRHVSGKFLQIRKIMKKHNKPCTHVLSEDTWSREVKDGCLYTKRVLTKTNRVPKWGERFFSAKSVKIIEESIVDPENKILVTYTRNLGFTKVMSVVERVEYRSAGPGQTIARRSAWIDSQVFGFSRAIRAFGVDRFKKNCNQMVSGFNDVLHSMFPRQVPASHTMTHTLKEMREAAAAATDRAKHNVLSSVNRT